MKPNIRERSQKVAEYIKTNVNQTLTAIAAATGLSKNGVHRHQRAIEHRQQHSESSWWETQIGYQFLVRLVVGVIYFFGVKQGVGAESLSEFIQTVHLATHVASSPSALRDLKRRVNQAIIDYVAGQAEHCQPTEGQGICVGADETFFGLPLLVLVELASGFIFIETECENRTYATWVKQLEQWWNHTQWQCHYLVSDGARVLIKLAVSGLGCVNVADLFHALRALGRPIGSTLGRQFVQLKKQHEKLQSQLSKANDLTKRQALQAQIETNVVAQQRLEQDQQTYHETLEEISQIIHPFAFDTHHWQLGKVLTAHLVKPLNSLSVLAESYGGDRAQKAIDAFESQISSFAEGIEA